MKKFLKEIGLFLLILIATSFTLNQIFRKQFDYSGNEIYTQKKTYFLDKETEFNTVFMGSSRIYRQLNPMVVDSILADHKISGFNLAAPATFNPEVYILYEKLIANNDLHFKYAFVELHPLAVIAPGNIATRKNYYFADNSYLQYAFEYIGNSNRNFPERIYLYSTYLLSYILKQISMPAFHDMNHVPVPFVNRQNGFYSLTRELENEKILRLKRRTTEFFKDTSELGDRIRSAKRWFDRKRENTVTNTTHINKLLHLIELSRKKGIELYFIIPPRHTDYSEIMDAKYNLPEGRVIELADYESYPELYRASYSFDIGHLNEQGSKLLSTYFAHRFRDILTINKDERITDSVSSRSSIHTSN